MLLHCLNSNTYFFSGSKVIDVFLPENTISARFCHGTRKPSFSLVLSEAEFNKTKKKKLVGAATY